MFVVGAIKQHPNFLAIIHEGFGIGGCAQLVLDRLCTQAHIKLTDRFPIGDLGVFPVVGIDLVAVNVDTAGGQRGQQRDQK